MGCVPTSYIFDGQGYFAGDCISEACCYSEAQSGSREVLVVRGGLFSPLLESSLTNTYRIHGYGCRREYAERLCSGMSSRFLILAGINGRVLPKIDILLSQDILLKVCVIPVTARMVQATCCRLERARLGDWVSELACSSNGCMA